MSGKQVAVVVHNDVVRDARVRKQVSTLVRSGLEVDVYGVSKEGLPSVSSIEGSRSFTLTDLSDTGSKIGKTFFFYQALFYGLRKWKHWLRKLKFVLFFALGFISAFIVMGRASFLSSFILILAPLILLLFFKRRPVISFSNNVLGYLRRRFAYKMIAENLFIKLIAKKYDYIHAHDLIALIAAVKYKKKHPDVTLVWDAHELYKYVPYATKYEKKLMAGIIAGACDYIDKFITISESFKDIYKKEYPELPDATIVMNATKFTPVETNQKSPLRSKANITESQKILLFQGGLSQDRGIEALVESAKDLPESWSIVFMGWGKLESLVKKEADKINKTRAKDRPAIRVIPPAKQEELQSYSAGATVGIIPYENTNLNHLYCTPNKLWEYPNAGIPIVATDLVEIRKIVEEWGTGILLPRDFNSGDISKVVSQLEDEQINAWKVKCAKFSEAMSWEKFEDKLLAIYA